MKETITVNGTDHEVEVRPLTLICHRGEQKIESPSRLEVGPEETLYHGDRVGKLHSGTVHWLNRITNGCVVDGQTADQVRAMGLGHRHLLGLVDLLLKLKDMGVPVFVRQPESFLHPSMAVNLGDFFIALTKD